MPAPADHGALMSVLLIALLAILAQPTRPPVDFIATVLGQCEPHVEPGVWVGCSAPAPDGETLWAGLVWDGATVTLETGP